MPTASVTLQAPAVPLLCLLDELGKLGYRPESAMTLHTPSCRRKLYDDRQILAKRAYLECVIGQKELWRRGHIAFRSDQCGAYYVLLLKSSTPLLLKMNEKMAKQRAVADSKDGAVPTELDAEADAPSASGYGVGHGDDREIEVDDAEEDAQPWPSKAMNEDGGDEDMHDGDSDDTNVVVPISIEGRRVTKEVRRTGHWGLRLTCPAHSFCDRCRAVNMWLPEFGANGPAYYLGCWLSEAWSKSHAEHSAWKPTPAEVRACVDRGKPDIQYQLRL